MLTKIRKKMKSALPEKLNNKEGAALIISLFVLTVLFGLTACFSLASVGELNESSRYLDSAEAFWIAEAAVNRFIRNTAMLDDGDQYIVFGENAVLLEKDDSDPQLRVVTATATANGIERVVSVEFPASVPNIYDNTLSSGGDAAIDGFAGGMLFGGLSRISGEYTHENPFVGISFEDLEENVDNSETTLGYEDIDGNEVPDEFTDFVEYNRRLTDDEHPDFLGEYAANEVIYYPTNETVEIDPDEDLAGIKVIFVEGPAPGEGDVEVWFSTAWAPDQNVTIVSTGSVTFLQPLEDPAANSKLNTVSWGNYNEGAVWFSAHGGVTYTRGSANFGSIASLSRTTGAIIAEEGLNAFLLFVGKEFVYENPIDEDGLVPPAFQGLVSGAASDYSDTPNNWAEVWEVAAE